MMSEVKKTPALERLQADLIFLMNDYSGYPCSTTAQAIAKVMQGILLHPLIELFPEFREQCVKGLRDWNLRAITSKSKDPSRQPLSIH